MSPDNGSINQLTVELEESVSEAFTTEHIDGTQLEAATISKNQWHETKLFKDYETFNEFRTSCEDHGLSRSRLHYLQSVTI